MAVATAEGSKQLWPRLQAAHEQWVLLYAVLFAAIANTAINTGLGWLAIQHRAAVPKYGIGILHATVITQALGTLFFLPFFTTLITTAGVRAELQRGAMERLEAPGNRVWAGLFPARVLVRALRLGAITLLVAGPITAAVIAGVVHSDMSRHTFLLFNTAWSVALGAFVTPIVAIAAMCDEVHALASEPVA
jgi:hypothetical protein